MEFKRWLAVGSLVFALLFFYLVQYVDYVDTSNYNTPWYAYLVISIWLFASVINKVVMILKVRLQVLGLVSLAAWLLVIVAAFIYRLNQSDNYDPHTYLWITNLCGYALFFGWPLLDLYSLTSGDNA